MESPNFESLFECISDGVNNVIVLVHVYSANVRGSFKLSIGGGVLPRGRYTPGYPTYIGKQHYQFNSIQFNSALFSDTPIHLLCRIQASIVRY